MFVHTAMLCGKQRQEDGGYKANHIKTEKKETDFVSYIANLQSTKGQNQIQVKLWKEKITTYLTLAAIQEECLTCI